MKVLISRFYFSLLLFELFFNSVTGQDTSKFNYYAVFDNILDSEAGRIFISKSCFSGDYDISADGSKIAFILNGYYEGGWFADNEVYSYDGNYTKLTAMAEYAIRTSVRISGNGSKIVFNDGHPTDRWTSVNFDASDFLHLEYQGYNFSGLAIDSLGNTIYYSDDFANGGRILNSDGSGNFDLIPEWHPIFLWASYYACMNDAGNIITFYG